MEFRAIVNAAVLQCKKHSPEILMAVGIGGMITGGVLACRATAKKVVPRKQTHEDNVFAIENDLNKEVIEEDEAKKLIKKECASYAFDIAKTYAIPVVIEAGSVACILASNAIMRKRVAGLTAAFTTVSTAFEAYRERVRERYGEDVESSIYLNEKTIEIGEIDEKGKTKKETITVADPDISSIGRYLTRSNPNWSNSDQWMEDQFRIKQNYLSDLLNTRGYIILNDCYDQFDFEHDTEAGIVVGQVADRNKCGNIVEMTWKKTKILDDVGRPQDAYYVDWPGLEIIYGKGAGHRSIET